MEPILVNEDELNAAVNDTDREEEKRAVELLKVQLVLNVAPKEERFKPGTGTNDFRHHCWCRQYYLITYHG